MRNGAIAAVAVIALAIAATYVAHNRTFLPLDTTQVLDGVGNLDRCLHAHVYSHCELANRPVGPFPPAQYLLAFAAKRLGASYSTAARVLVYTNGIAVLGILGLLAWAGTRLLPRRVVSALLLVAISGPLAWYSEAGFGEALASLLTLATVVAFALRAPFAITVVAAFLAGLTKETAPIFLVPLAATIAASRREQLSSLLPVATGALAAALFNGGFNVLRYGTFYNQYYAEPARITPGVGLKAQFFAGQLAAPNAGLLWFWPAALLLLGTAVWLGLRQPERSRRVAAAMLAATGVALLLIFAAYHSPYGWNALGPRYLLPWVPALCFAGALVARAELEALLAALRRRALPIVAVVIILALPQIGFFVSPLAAFKLFDDTRPPCNYLPGSVLEAYEQPNFYDCTTHTAWAARPVLLYGADELRSPLTAALAALFTAGAATVAAAAVRGTPARSAQASFATTSAMSSRGTRE